MRKRTITILVTAVAAGLAGCEVGPDYAPPTVTVLRRPLTLVQDAANPEVDGRDGGGGGEGVGVGVGEVLGDVGEVTAVEGGVGAAARVRPDHDL